MFSHSKQSPTSLLYINFLENAIEVGIFFVVPDVVYSGCFLCRMTKLRVFYENICDFTHIHLVEIPVGVGVHGGGIGHGFGLDPFGVELFRLDDETCFVKPYGASAFGVIGGGSQTAFFCFIHIAAAEFAAVRQSGAVGFVKEGQREAVICFGEGEGVPLRTDEYEHNRTVPENADAAPACGFLSGLE